jgi:hypothetical protein
MGKHRNALDDVLDEARRRGEYVGNQLYHGWGLSDYEQLLWEEVLEGIFAQEEGFPDHEEEIAEAAMHARHCAFYSHDVASCDRHVAEYVMDQVEDSFEVFQVTR